MPTKAIAVSREEPAVRNRRQLLFLLAAGTAWLWSVQAFGQSALDENGNPILLPGQTPTPEMRALERDSIERSQNQVIQNRANERSVIEEQQFQNDRATAQQRENAVQQNFDRQRMDILNNRDKP